MSRPPIASGDRWLVLGFGHPRARWFSRLAHWATAAAVPVEFVKCISADEVRARIAGGRTYSALLVGGNVSGFDRDLVHAGAASGAAVIVVDPPVERDWGDLGVVAQLSGVFEPDDLMAVLREHARPVRRMSSPVIPAAPAERDTGWAGRLLAVTGPGGTGTSVTAMALAQSLAARPSDRGLVLLADFARNGEQAMIHDAREVVPGLLELIEAHRVGRLGAEEIREMVFDVVERGYHLLLGLRRHRDWTAVRPRSFDAALDGLVRSYRHVVADIDADTEGETETGSIDVEERNLVARTTLERADLVVVVGTPGPKGIHSQARTLRDLRAFGVPAERLMPVVNRAPRSPRRRADLLKALTALSAADATDQLADPLLIPDRRDLDGRITDGLGVPAAIADPLIEHAERRLRACGRRQAVGSRPVAPVAVLPGSLGSFTEQAG